METKSMELASSSDGADSMTKSATNVAVDLPQDAAEALEEKWGDLSEYALEILALEEYRSGALTPEQLHDMLSLKARP